jgi:hypothetical protein
MIVERIVPYEILIRFNDAGALQGAHLGKRRIVENMDTGERIADQIIDPQPLGVVGNEYETTLRSVLGDALAAALRDIEHAQAAQALADKEIESLRDQLAAAKQALAAAEKVIELMSQQQEPLNDQNAIQ